MRRFWHRPFANSLLLRNEYINMETASEGPGSMPKFPRFVASKLEVKYVGTI